MAGFDFYVFTSLFFRDYAKQISNGNTYNSRTSKGIIQESKYD